MTKTRVKKVKTRKPHRCTFCNRVIEKGSSAYVFSLFPNGNKDIYCGPVDTVLTEYSHEKCHDKLSA